MTAIVLALISTAAAIVAAMYAGLALRPTVIQASQRRFVERRRAANASRARLSRKAAQLAPPGQRLPHSSLISHPQWMPGEPLRLSSVRLKLDIDHVKPSTDQLVRLSRRYLPRHASGRYETYSEALGALDPPRLYSNRVSYRLLDCDLQGSLARMTFGLCHYFEMIDIGEVLALEFSLLRSSVRRTISNPFDLKKRLTSPSINTLTLRVDKDGEATYFLHLRDPRDVALASGQTHVIPCGGFQPSGASRFAVEEDFNLWHNIVREYAEEFLGLEEANSDVGDPLDFDSTEPYASLLAGERANRIRPWLFGLALDPLTYYVEVLTTVVFDAEVFDMIFPKVVSQNDEGLVVRGSGRHRGIAFSEENVGRTLAEEQLAPAGAACISLAWKHREQIFRNGA